MDAIGAGFIVSIGVLVGGLAVAALMLPNRMRETQAQGTTELATSAAPSPMAAPGGAVAAGAVAAETEAA